MAASGNGIAAALSQSELAAIAEKMAHARYSRSNEFDADQYAVRFMNQNRCDSGAAVTALRKLETILGDESDIFASHPAPGERARALEELRSTSAAEFTRGL
jgi:putative metalloprotease